MGESRILVYTGPTLPAHEVHAALPGAEVRPPAGRGDLLAERWRPGDTAVVLDGYFRERRSVGHKEILQVLAERVEVVGAASMGALRAAELGPCGMLGRGIVHEMYASGEIDGDDEVGVLHGPAAAGYPVRTVALVNLRYACAEAVGEGRLSPDAAQRIVGAAKSLPFTHRTPQDIGSALDPADRRALEPLLDGIESGRWDIKRLDATRVLREIAERAPAEPGVETAHVPFTGISRTQALVRKSTREYAPGRWMSDLDALNAARLFDDGYPALHEKVLTGLLEDFAVARGLSLEAYALAKLGLEGRGAVPEPLRCWLTGRERAELPGTEQINLLMVRVWPVWQSADWRPAVLARLRESGRWGDWCALVADADAAAAESAKLVVPSAAVCGRLFPRHWKAEGSTPEIESARRGFPSLDALGAAVTRFFAYDIRRGRAGDAAR